MATAPTVDENGISVPQYSDILTFLKTQYRAIFGDDVYLESDSQDGQFLAIVAAAINDCNAAAVAIYNSFSPSTAQGNGLSSNVKINGISRLLASNSTVLVTLGGTVGTIINNGVVSDGSNRWLLPVTVTIPIAGEVTVTATAQDIGAITAQAGTITTIATPTYGWTSVTNANAATPGSPVETDAALRVRQSTSVALPSISALEGIMGAVQNLEGVTRVKAYENDTSSTDGNGLPEHSISVVVLGGNSAAIAGAIAAKKTPGAYTNGSTSVSVVDAFGIPQTIRFSAPELVPIDVAVNISALSGYASSIGDEIKAALLAHVAALDIGESVIVPRLYVPAQLAGSANSETYKVTALTVCLHSGTPGTTDITIDFDGLATLDIANITLTVA